MVTMQNKNIYLSIFSIICCSLKFSKVLMEKSCYRKFNLLIIISQPDHSWLFGFPVMKKSSDSRKKCNGINL